MNDPSPGPTPDRVQPSTSLTTWLKGIPASDLEGVLEAAMRNAAHGLSGMVGYTIHVLTFLVTTMPLSQIITYAGDPEAETVGIYLLLKGDLHGQAILLLSPADAHKLAWQLMGAPAETISHLPVHDLPTAAHGPSSRTWKLNDLERSALAEAGNLMVSYFLNTVAACLGQPRPLYPSPPAVMVDMLGAVLDVVAASIAAQSDELLAITCDLQPETPLDEGTGGEAEKMFQVHLWIMPDPAL